MQSYISIGLVHSMCLTKSVVRMHLSALRMHIYHPRCHCMSRVCALATPHLLALLLFLILVVYKLEQHALGRGSLVRVAVHHDGRQLNLLAFGLACQHRNLARQLQLRAAAKGTTHLIIISLHLHTQVSNRSELLVHLGRTTLQVKHTCIAFMIICCCK